MIDSVRLETCGVASDGELLVKACEVQELITNLIGLYESEKTLNRIKSEGILEMLGELNMDDSEWFGVIEEYAEKLEKGNG